MNDNSYGQPPYGALPNGPAVGGAGYGYGFGYTAPNAAPPPPPPAANSRRWQPWHIAVAATLAVVLTACLCCGSLSFASALASTSAPDGYLGTGPKEVLYFQFHEHNGGLAGTLYADVKDSNTGQITSESFDLTGTHDGNHYTFTVHGWLGISVTVQGVVSGRVLNITYENNGILNQAQLAAASDQDYNNAVAQLARSIPAKTSVPTTAPTQIPQQAAPNVYAPNVPVPVASTLYQTPAPGNCDTQGGAWSQNSVGVQSCSGNSLVLAVPNCDCPISVVALTSIPGVAYPSNYVAQISATPVSGDPRVRFGFKFRQQSVDDSGNGRGGYSFLINSQGAWEFMRYDSGGSPTRLDQSTLGKTLTGTIVLTLVVRGNTYAFYVDGQLVATESDSTYTSGFFALAVSPNRTVKFHNLSVYAPK